MNKLKDTGLKKEIYENSTITTSNTNNNIEFKRITVEEHEFCPPEKTVVSSSRKSLLLNAEEAQKTSTEIKTHLNDAFNSSSNFRKKSEEKRASEKGIF